MPSESVIPFGCCFSENSRQNSQVLQFSIVFLSPSLDFLYHAGFAQWRQRTARIHAEIFSRGSVPQFATLAEFFSGMRNGERTRVFHNPRNHLGNGVHVDIVSTTSTFHPSILLK